MTVEELKASHDYALDTYAFFQGVSCHMRVAHSFIRLKKPDPETSIEYVVMAIAEMEKLKKHLEAWDQHRPLSSLTKDDMPPRRGMGKGGRA